MRYYTYILIGLGLLYIGMSNSPKTSSSHIVTSKALYHHVEFLSSDAMAGRLTGTGGEKFATQYAANIFEHLGLEPAGDKGTFFQEFVFTSGVSLGYNNSFTVTDPNGQIKNFVLDQDWRPLSFSDNQIFSSAEVVFAGFGITAPALGDLPAYDSYRGLNVKNKWVIVFRYTPEKIGAEQSRQLSQYSSLRYKAFTAKEHGARGIIFVSGPNSRVKHELIPLSFDTSLSGSGLVAISVKDIVINELLKKAVHPYQALKQLQDRLDSGELASIPDLSGVKLTCHVDVQKNKLYGRNVLARLKVGGPTAPLLVVGAHVDHLGRGDLSGSRSRENEVKLIHNGADDNASGVASVLEAAVMLSEMKAQGRLQGDKNILFAVWSGEELGLLGSAHFVKNFMESSNNKSLRPAIAANINLDMVGRLRQKLVLQGVSSSLMWPKLIEGGNKRLALPLLMQNDPYLPTDSTSFYLHGVPTLNLFTGSHDEYHTPRDQQATLNYEGLKGVTNFLIALVLALEVEPAEMDYQSVAKTGDHPGRGFRVYLGTIPDYASADTVGVKLSGVTKDSPAERAGLKQDDVILELAGKKIHDIYDYTFVLSALHVGEPVQLVVRRGSVQVPLTIVARSRE